MGDHFVRILVLSEIPTFGFWHSTVQFDLERLKFLMDPDHSVFTPTTTLEDNFISSARVLKSFRPAPHVAKIQAFENANI